MPHNETPCFKHHVIPGVFHDSDNWFEEFQNLSVDHTMKHHVSNVTLSLDYSNVFHDSDNRFEEFQDLSNCHTMKHHVSNLTLSLEYNNRIP